jgi:hypothetical protein
MTPVEEIAAAELADPGAFQSRVAQRCAPVLIRGLCAGWPAATEAAHSWSALADYLLGFDRGGTAEAFVGDAKITGRYSYGDGADGFNFRRETMGMREALARIAAHAEGRESGTLYMGSLRAGAHFPGFAAANPMPLPGIEVEPRIWMGNASNVSCHYDTYDNLACAVAGRRRFTLYPPEAIADLYVGPIDHTMAGQPVSLAASSTPGDPRYPQFESWRERALVAELEPGDALYLPKLWWHQVEALDRANLLVNYWWDGFAAGPDAPLTTMMLAMIAIAERPDAERAAWRSFFDHYVFRPDGHPLAHLPEERHGILGPLRTTYGRIRAIVMQTLRG